MNNDVKQIKTIIEVSKKNFDTLLFSEIKNLKEIIYKNHEKINDKIKEEISFVYDRFQEIKIENGKYHLQAMNQCKEFTIKMDDIKYLKEEYEKVRDIDKGEVNEIKIDVEDMKVTLDILRKKITYMSPTVNIYIYIYNILIVI